jgi:type I restriction enzyme, S subunit
MSFPKYEVYKDSGVEWLGEVPEHWEMSRVKFDSYVKARVGWHGLKSDEFTEEGPYLVTGSDFKNRTVDWKNCYHCTVERYDQDKYIQLKEGDLLITKDGTIGKLILVEGIPGNATLNSGIFVVRPFHERYSTQFYFWLLQSSVFCDFITIHKTGSTISHLYQETFENLPYALPACSEQAQIAHFLDRETARIDALIAEQQRLIELLKEKRQAVISHAVTKGIDRTVPMKDSGVEWLGEVPKHWKYGLKLLNLALEEQHSFVNGPFGSDLLTSELTDDGVPVIYSGDVKSGHFFRKSNKYVTPEKAKQLNFCRVDPGNLLLAKVGDPPGEAAIYPIDSTSGIVTQDVVRVRIDEKKAVAGYICYLLNSKAGGYMVKLISVEATRTRFSLGDFKSIRVCIAPLSEQVQIAQFLDKETVRIDALVEQANIGVSLLQERRSALISAAVTGKIDVRNWQPSPEPTATHGRQ